ncbi:toxin-antitoxin system YwqK family antitoxin [Polaribacter sp. SA4-12]|uniref:toxin-antitoxin system YwqK family antitoxin n=1 Tax=Polaribacter sp. SA4-12 TaxID=1312072 RepID=UPI000B3C2A95|nr:hypothetical protein [Polaribacter sp. SA4-12]ARV14006.1 hypothetical protein BTO07_02075 [Polaribacter sp. SA4-12]
MDDIIIPSIEKNKADASFKLKNGILFFDNVPYSGIVKEFYFDEKVKSSSQYYQGKKQGNYLGFYVNGNKWFQRSYTNGIKTGIHSGWFETGKQMFEYHINDKGVYHGSVKDWHYNGQLARYFNFVDGKEAGTQKMWNSKGKIRANFYTVKGERHGLIGLKNCVSVLKTDHK